MIFMRAGNKRRYCEEQNLLQRRKDLEETIKEEEEKCNIKLKKEHCTRTSL